MLKMRTDNGLVHRVVAHPTEGYSVRGYAYTACGVWLSSRPFTDALETCLWCVADYRRLAP